jgi:hypothetical protein
MAKTPPFPELDPGRKRTAWETIVITTPVILTVVATVLAGLSSSEMSSAQYFRSLAAQMQSKVSDQWGYFQAKKLRAEQCGNTVAIIRGMSQSIPVDQQEFSQTMDQLMNEMRLVSMRVRNANAQNFQLQLPADTTRPDGMDQMAAFLRGDIPTVEERPIGNQQILDAIRAVGSNASEVDLEQQAGKISQDDLDKATTVANQNSAAFDNALDQLTVKYSGLAQKSEAISRHAAAFERAAREAPDQVVSMEPAGSLNTIHELNSQLSNAVAVARLGFNANRYQREAHYNEVLADLLEIQVRRQGFTSDRHRVRSKEFFYGMLGAQAGVTIATFSLAVQRRNLLWGLAASAGLAAVTFAAYVYMFV